MTVKSINNHYWLSVAVDNEDIAVEACFEFQNTYTTALIGRSLTLIYRVVDTKNGPQHYVTLYAKRRPSQAHIDTVRAYVEGFLRGVAAVQSGHLPANHD
jgi:hypothetical protein